MKWWFSRKKRADKEKATVGMLGISDFFPSIRSEPNWFQKGGKVPTTAAAKAHAAVYACVTILSQEVSRLRINHFLTKEDGSRESLTGSAVTRVLRNPNHYQTRSDFFLFLMEQLLLTGNTYAYAERNDVGTVMKLHPRPSNEVEPWVVPETGDIFYSLQSRDLDKDMVQEFPEKFLVPARDVLHIKLTASGHPLVGETPLVGMAYAVPQGINIQRDSTSFFGRMSRPSGVLKTPNKIGAPAAMRLKEMWEKGLADNFSGRTAILDNGLEWQPLTMSAADAQLIEQYNMTVQDIAMVYRVPLYMLGDLTKATFNNVETLQKAFQAGSLGFYTEHIEAALDKFFGLDQKSYVEFDMERGIVRTELEARMSAYAKGVQGGLLTINEARALDNRPPVPGGDDVFLQRQNWPIDLLGADAAKELSDAIPQADTEETNGEEMNFSDSVIKQFKLIQGGE